eukprot:CAMPEP_0201498476 /NCGR_PEP_ID=MMETSP0151_2-20130828/71365_1 /ASSEMBLY_ACC=CAM_ASM_000257 /TAXON_ID=200890 /ORGANISM="Paramoeba atlantica, Strain 621/1 / CCAP 1560/9" /LENGTH=84 /DNA_ID=CAMNT_0047890075 /DNA_START=385 /DNA_END=639 /DNA_ORIENTATION=+
MVVSDKVVVSVGNHVVLNRVRKRIMAVHNGTIFQAIQRFGVHTRRIHGIWILPRMEPATKHHVLAKEKKENPLIQMLGVVNLTG